MPKKLFDEIGYWSEVKLDIVREYAKSYSVILTQQKKPRLHHSYIDAFAGPGQHVSKQNQSLIAGSPTIALQTRPPFEAYHFIDIEKIKVAELRRIAEENPERVRVYEGDCNRILLEEVLPKVRWDHYERALCLLDPYGLHLDWQVIWTAGQSKTVEIFLNFAVADMNRNVLWRNPEKVDKVQIRRMNQFWGDESWREVCYSTEGNLFGFPEKTENDVIAEAFRKRLKDVAGFGYVPNPIPMRNSKGAVVYYLYFASPKPVAAKIVEAIFNKYRDRKM